MQYMYINRKDHNRDIYLIRRFGDYDIRSISKKMSEALERGSLITKTK